MRQLLAEHLTLAVISGLLGLLVAEAAIRFILAIKPGNLARTNEVGLDPQVLGWALMLCLLTGILVGLAPAITVSRDNLNPSSQEAGRSVAGGVAMRGTRRGLIVIEFALALMLLASAGLLIRSLQSVENVALGFIPERVLSVQLSTPAFMATGQRAHFYNRVLEQIKSLPGVESAGIIENFFINASPERMLTTEAAAGTVSEHVRLRTDAISGAFFQTLLAPLRRGASFRITMGLILRAWQSSTTRRLAVCGPDAIQ